MRKVNASLHKVIAAEVEMLKDPRLGFVTITAVDTSPDLRNAVVSYAVLGDDDQRAETGKALAAATPRVQRGSGASNPAQVHPAARLQVRRAGRRRGTAVGDPAPYGGRWR